LQILELKDLAQLKTYALFNRQKTRDLYDVATILKSDTLPLSEIERIYSFTNKDIPLREYIERFDATDDAMDNSLDFLPEHSEYKLFAKKNQKERFDLAKNILLEQYDYKRRVEFEEINRNIRKANRS
jgi:predicted nucleotidyltransferase component of viral defense system